jgi:hypothetical protein
LEFVHVYVISFWKIGNACNDSTVKNIFYNLKQQTKTILCGKTCILVAGQMAQTEKTSAQKKNQITIIIKLSCF